MTTISHLSKPIKLILSSAIILICTGLHAQNTPQSLLNGVWTTNDTAIAQNSLNAIANATNGLSFTNTSIYIGTGYANDSVNGQNSYFSADWRIYNGANVGLAIGGDFEYNTAGTGLHQLDGRISLVKDVNNFQVYGHLMAGRQFDGQPDYFAGLGAGVRYNLTAGLANSSNPLLNFIGGMGKVNTYAETRFDLYSMVNNVSLNAITVQKTWRFAVGVAF